MNILMESYIVVRIYKMDAYGINWYDDNNIMIPLGFTVLLMNFLSVS